MVVCLFIQRANSAEDRFMTFFLCFQKPEETICLKGQCLFFSGENKKKYFKLLSGPSCSKRC